MKILGQNSIVSHVIVWFLEIETFMIIDLRMGAQRNEKEQHHTKHALQIRI